MQVKQQQLKECYIMQVHYHLLEVYIYNIFIDIDEGTTAMDFLAQ